MNPLDFFNPAKKVDQFNVYRGARKESIPVGLNCSFSDLCLSEATASGTDYVEEHIKKADQELFESSKFIHRADNQFDQISVTTAPVAEPLQDLQSDIYKTYNLTYQSEGNYTIKTVHEKIVASIAAEPVTIIQGPTGCGKTTQVPQMILDYCAKKRLNCNIIVTQPRRIAAISIAKRVSKELQCPLGSLVGYKVGLSTSCSTDTRLIYCTTGVLLQKLIRAKNLNEFTHIIIDEVHERDQEMDFLLLVIKKLLHLNSFSVKIILMSATFQVEKFAKYFASYIGTTLTPARIIDVTKRNYYNVKEFYLCELRSLGTLPEVNLFEPSVTADMINFAGRLITVMDKIDSQSDADENCATQRPACLVFLPGIHEIEEMHTHLSNPKYKDAKWDIVVLHSSITNEEQQQIFLAPPKDHRRIILSTNIAESSITVPDVKYVVDFCLTKQLTIDPSTNFQSLELTWASKANCQQRAGRTGRVMDGRVYRLIPKALYKKLVEENPPDIVKAPLENVVLRTKLLNMGKPQALLALALDPPDLCNLERTILLLKEVGGLVHIEEDRFDGEITDLGQVMASLPIDIHISKMIVLGHVFSVLRESIIVGASMAVKNMFSTPFQRKLEAYNAKLVWAQNSCSDSIAFLNVYNVWMREKANQRIKSDVSEKAWAQRNCLQIRVLREIEALIQEITKRLEFLGIKETVGDSKVTLDNVEKTFILKVVFAGGFYPYYFTTQSLSDENQKIKLLGGMDPLKTVYLQGWPMKQPGPLYAKKIQECFDKCLNSKAGNIKVKFDNSSRVYVYFGRFDCEDDKQTAEMQGEVPTTVYRALKMREHKKILIPVMDSESALERAKKLNINTDVAPLLFRHITEDMSKPPKNEIRPCLPGLKDEEINLYICRVINPAHFWAQIKNQEIKDYLMHIESYINVLMKQGLEKFQSSPAVGTLLLVPVEVFGKTEFRRAVVQSISMTNKKNILTQVLQIDYGVVTKIAVSDLRSLPDDNPISNIPALAFECVLTNIKPSVLNTLAEEWSYEARKIFETLIKRNIKHLRGQIFSVVNSIVSLILYCGTPPDQTNVNEYLIQQEFADYREEDHLSKYNNELRKNVKDLSEENKLYHEEMQYNQNYLNEIYPTPPDDTECPGVVNLRGPYSPLEVNVSSLTIAGLGKKIKIAEASVNSVLLDHTLVNPPQRLLIAGSVNQSPINSNLTLRNTTMMPSLPGLVPLLCLIFAPQVELRRNKYGTKYSGALCGLGFNKNTKQSLFREHDMSLLFDVEISIDDLSDINRLRHYMSTGIFVTTEDDDATQDTLECQEKVRNIFFKIIDKHREKIFSEMDLKHNQWCKYDSDMFLKPGSITEIRKNIFKLHWALDLKEKDEIKEAMIEHLQELRSMASLSFKDDTGERIHCKLCKQDIFGIIQLRGHINSKNHRFEENRILHS